MSNMLSTGCQSSCGIKIHNYGLYNLMQCQHFGNTIATILLTYYNDLVTGRASLYSYIVEVRNFHLHFSKHIFYATHWSSELKSSFPL